MEQLYAHTHNNQCDVCRAITAGGLLISNSRDTHFFFCLTCNTVHSKYGDFPGQPAYYRALWRILKE